MREYTNAHDAIRDATGTGKSCVGWDPKINRWVVYDPRRGAPEGVRPEFLCLRNGLLPVPLSEEGREIIRQLLEGAVWEGDPTCRN